MPVKFSFYANNNGREKFFEKEFQWIDAMFNTLSELRNNFFLSNENNVAALKEGNNLIDFDKYIEREKKFIEERKEQERLKQEEERRKREEIKQIENALTFIENYLKSLPDDAEALKDKEELLKKKEALTGS